MRRAILFVFAAVLVIGAAAVANDKPPAESYLEIKAENSRSIILVEFAAMVMGHSLEMRARETPFVVPVDTPTVGGWLFQKKSGAGDLTVRYVGTDDGAPKNSLPTQQFGQFISPPGPARRGRADVHARPRYQAKDLAPGSP